MGVTQGPEPLRSSSGEAREQGEGREKVHADTAHQERKVRTGFHTNINGKARMNYEYRKTTFPEEGRETGDE